MGNNCGKDKKRTKKTLPLIVPNDNYSHSSISHVKLILMGPKGSGKTTFFKTFMNDPSNPFKPEDLNTNYTDIIKNNFYSIKLPLNNKNVKINLWDLAGDMDSTVKNVTKNMIHFTDGVFLLFDLLNRKSFRETSSMWYEMIEESMNLNLTKSNL